MSNIDEKLSKMTRAQANALADHLNAGYNKPAYKPTAKTKKKTTAPKKATAKKPAAKKTTKAAPAEKAVKKPGRKPKAAPEAPTEKDAKKPGRKPKTQPEAEKAPAKRTRKPKETKE